MTTINDKEKADSLSFRISFFWRKYKEQMAKKGPLNLLIDISCALIFFVGLHSLFKWFWPSLEAFCVTKYHELFALNILLAIWNPIVNIFFLVLHLWQPSVLEKYRVGKNPWRWNQMSKEEARKDMIQTLSLTFFNIMIVGPLFISLSILLLTSEKGRPRVDMQSYPNISESILWFAFQWFVFDLTFYINHRILHLPFIYSYLHKVTTTLHFL
jgi:hypothetical protein